MKNYTLDKHQKDFKKLAMSDSGRAIAFHEPGRGKTLTSLDTCLENKYTTIICCPAGLKPNWIAEMKKFGFDKNNYALFGYEEIQKYEFKPSNFNFILDESHYIKNPESLRTAHIRSVLMNQQKGFRLFLTGTPIKRDFLSLYYQMQALLDGKWISKSKFLSFFKLRPDPFSGQFIPVKLRVEKESEFFSLLRKHVHHVGADTKNLKDPKFIYLDMPSSKKLNKALEEAYFDSDSDSEAKKDAAIIKAKKSIVHIKQLVENFVKPIVFTCHPDAALFINRKVKPSLLVTSDMSIDERFKTIEAFEKAKTGALIMTVGVAAVGYNLQFTNYMYFNDYPWCDSEFKQCIKRIHRRGQTKKCFIYVPLVGPMDKKIFNTIKSKAFNSKAFENVFKGQNNESKSSKTVKNSKKKTGSKKSRNGKKV